MKKKINKVITYLLVISMFMGCVPVAAATKDETIYSKRNNDGSEKSTIISEHLYGSSEDESLLSNIVNVNGDETYTNVGTDFTWNGDNIYYQGTTNSELPITMNITYKLNDKEENLVYTIINTKKVIENYKNEEFITNISEAERLIIDVLGEEYAKTLSFYNYFFLIPSLYFEIISYKEKIKKK